VKRRCAPTPPRAAPQGKRATTESNIQEAASERIAYAGIRPHEDGTLTSTPLWDAESGAFPCGAIVPGINDGERSCATLHQRLNVNTNGRALPLR